MIFDKDRTILVNKNTSDSLTTKALSLHIFVFLGTVATIAIIGVSYYFLTTLQESMLRDKKHEVKNMVDTAYSLILHFQNLAKSGKLKEEDAKIQAINTLRQIRFDNSNYFWINDSTIPYPVMLMHPAIPSLENRVMNDKQFNCAVAIQYGDSGKYIKLENKPSIFTAFAKVCNSNGSGFVEYRWPKPTKDASITAMYYPKISYVKKVNDWNWIVGSGIYIDDVEASYSTIATRIESIVGVIILLYLVLTVMIATRLFRYEKDIIKARDETNTMFNISKDGIALLDLESNFLDCNNAYLEMTGFTKKELLETSCIALSIPEDMEKAKAVMLKVAEIGFVKTLKKPAS